MAQFLPVVRALLPRVLSLLAGFVRRPHEELAAAGARALRRLLKAAGAQLTHQVRRLFGRVYVAPAAKSKQSPKT